MFIFVDKVTDEVTREVKILKMTKTIVYFVVDNWSLTSDQGGQDDQDDLWAARMRGVMSAVKLAVESSMLSQE